MPYVAFKVKNRRFSPIFCPIIACRKKLGLTSVSTDIVRIEVVRADQPIQAKVVEFDGKQGVLLVQISGLPIGPFNEKIEITGTNGKGERVALVNSYVSGVVLGAWSADKSIVVLPRFVNAPSVAEFSVKCSNSETPDSVIAHIEPDLLDRFVKVELSEFPKVTISRTNNSEKVESFGRIVIQSKGDANKSIQVPIVLTGG